MYNDYEMKWIMTNIMWLLTLMWLCDYRVIDKENIEIWRKWFSSGTFIIPFFSSAYCRKLNDISENVWFFIKGLHNLSHKIRSILNLRTRSSFWSNPFTWTRTRSIASSCTVSSFKWPVKFVRGDNAYVPSWS